MKHLFTLALMAMLPTMTISAQGTRALKNSTRYITLNDGEVIAIPEKYILSESQDGGLCTLTLEGDTTFVYSVANVTNISTEYTGNHATLKSFAFTHDDNDQVYADVAATITEKDDTILINADVPVIGKRLRPSFSLSEGATMWVDGVQQISGQSSHRYTEPIVYTLAQPKHWIYEVKEVKPEPPNTGEWTLTKLDVSANASTNAPSNKETSEGLASLWDENLNTFYHSTWGSGSYLPLTWMNNGYWGDGITEWPYIEVELTETIENFCFSYTTSTQNNRFPQGFCISAMVVLQISARLNEQILEAIPTAIPWLADTSTLGNVVGSRLGSFMVAS
jgi:hypothetical protein